MPSEVDTEQTAPQSLYHRADQEPDAHGGSIRNRPPIRPIEAPEGEDDSEAGSIPKMIGKPAEGGRAGWAQSEAIEQQHAHEFRQVARHESHPKPGVPD